MLRRDPASRRHGLLGSALVALVFVSTPGLASDAGERADKRDRPEREIAIYTEYSRLTIPAGESVRLSLTVENRGRRDESITVALTRVPEGWTAAIKGGQFTVAGVPVPSEKSRVLTFSAEPEKGLPLGTYTFQIESTTADHLLVASTLVCFGICYASFMRQEIRAS